MVLSYINILMADNVLLTIIISSVHLLLQGQKPNMLINLIGKEILPAVTLASHYLANVFY